MDFNGYGSSPSLSPSNTIFSSGHHFDSTSDSSSPNSPHVNHMLFNGSMPFDIYDYSTAPANFYPHSSSSKMPVEVTRTAGNVKMDRDQRRKSSDAAKSGEREPMPHMHLRRRAQNRASQRAFRERKEKHVKGLEHQLEELHEKHQDLLQSYGKQIDEVTRLNDRIGELAAELSTLRHSQDSSFGDVTFPDKFDKFDAFSSTDMAYRHTDTFYDKGPVDFHQDFVLSSFEDSL